MEEWGSTAEIEAQNVRSVVQAYAEGRIELPPTKPRDGNKSGMIRIAPSFKPKADAKSMSEHPDVLYSAATLAQFLGWNESKVEAILNVLTLTEDGLLDEEDTVGLSIYQAEAAAKQARRINDAIDDKALAKSVGKKLAAGMHTATGRGSGRGSPKVRPTHGSAIMAE